MARVFKAEYDFQIIFLRNIRTNYSHKDRKTVIKTKRLKSPLGKYYMIKKKITESNTMFGLRTHRTINYVNRYCYIVL